MNRRILMAGSVIGVMVLAVVGYLQLRPSLPRATLESSTREALADRFHFQAIASLEQAGIVRATLDVSSSGQEKALRACLEGKGRGCRQFEGNSFKSFLDVEGVMNARVRLADGRACSEGASPDCPIERETSYRIVCPTDKSCERVDLVLETRLYDEKGALVLSRRSPVRISAAQILNESTTRFRGPFGPRRAIRFEQARPSEAPSAKAR